MKLQHIPLAFTDLAQSSTWFERFLAFPNGTSVTMCCADATPNSEHELHSLNQPGTCTHQNSYFFALQAHLSSPSLTEKSSLARINTLLMKLSPDLLFYLVFVLSFNNHFSAAKVEQLVNASNIRRFYYSNSLKSVCPVLHKHTGGHSVMNTDAIQAIE